jgi:chaperone required for assembly of F1-ATPase
MKRFWNEATVVAQDGHHVIRLDGRPMRLPGGPSLALRSRALAEAVAAEWAAAGGDFTAEDLPLTRLAGTAQENVARDPAPTIDALAGYAASDLLCYRAAAPQTLKDRQARCWQPWLDWARIAHGADLRSTEGVMPIRQPDAALAALRRSLIAATPCTLTGLGVLVPALGSLVLGLAVADGQLAPAEAHRLTLLDQLFQAEQWGEDPEALARTQAESRDIAIAAQFITLSRLP